MGKSRKKIIIIASVAVLGALLAACFTNIADSIYTPFDHYHKQEGNKWIAEVLYYMAAIKPMWYSLPEWKWKAWGAPVPLLVRIIDSLPWLIWSLLLLGYIFFLKGKAAGVRLMGFVFSLYFFFRLYYCINDIIKLGFIFTDRDIKIHFKSIIISESINITENIIWMVVFVVMLRELRKYARLAIVIKQYGTSPREEFVEAERWRRFLHTLVDSAALIFVAIIQGFIYLPVWGIRGDLNVQYAAIGTALLIRFLYYIIFESIWGATPAKFMFGTIVKNEKGEKPSFGQILGRTFSRFIPFDAFSFLGHRGWHDRASDTYVCKEETSFDEDDKAASDWDHEI